jgi:sugar lactone lactonase YvrE
MPEDVEVELVVDARAEVAEGPIWDDRAERLLWCDIMAGGLHEYDPATGRDEVRDVGQAVGTVVPREGGGLVLALRDGFALVEPDGGMRVVAEVEADNRANRMNDGACDSAGRFWAGTMAFDSTPGAGAFYRFDPDLTVTKVLDEVSISNGVGWSLDETTMYYVDSPTYRIDVFDFDAAAGAIENRRTLVDMPGEVGFADGLVVDAEGFLWVAVFRGGRLHRYAPDGTLDREVLLPVTCPTKPAFAGPELRDMYVTSAWATMTPEEREAQPHAGGVFRLDPGATGQRVKRFAG